MPFTDVPHGKRNALSSALVAVEEHHVKYPPSQQDLSRRGKLGGCRGRSSRQLAHVQEPLETSVREELSTRTRTGGGILFGQRKWKIRWSNTFSAGMVLHQRWSLLSKRSN